MPAYDDIAIVDREDTPVTHTFTPRAPSNGVAVFKNTSGVPIGDETITLSSRLSGSKLKNRLVLSVPIMVTETINGVSVPKVDRVSYADLTLTFAESSTLQERQNVVGMLADALAEDQTLVDGVLTGLEGVY